MLIALLNIIGFKALVTLAHNLPHLFVKLGFYNFKLRFFGYYPFGFVPLGAFAG